MWRRGRKEQMKIMVSAHIAIIHNQNDGGVFHLVPLLVSNIGRDSVILKEVVFYGPSHKGTAGWFREPGAAYGVREQVLPKELKSGESIELPVLSIGIFRNDVEEIAVIDSDDRKHRLSREDMMILREQSKKYLKLIDVERSASA